MLNRVLIQGRLTKDPELRRTQTGVAVTSITVAVNRDFKDKDSGNREADFIDCVAWRGTAEFVSQRFTKGQETVIDGRLQNRKWTDKEGHNRTSAEIIIDNIYFCGPKKGSTSPTVYRSDDGKPEEEYTEDDGDLPWL